MAASTVVRHVVLTGIPGVGKTTLIQKLVSELQNKGITVEGFYTTERREHGTRTGFDIVTLDGERAPLARVGNLNEFQGKNKPKVGKYDVELHSFEQVAVPILRKKIKGGSIVVIDEIGKMELFSNSFRNSVRKILENPESVIIATIPVPKGRPLPFVEEVRSRADAKVYQVTRENRNHLIEEIMENLQTILKEKT